MMEKKWWVLLGTGIASIMLGIDYSIVNTSLAPIQRELHATVIQLQWLLSGFGIFFVGLLMTAGRLGDIRGRRKFLYVGILGFAAASLGAGLSPSPNFLIAMRMLQGLFCAYVFRPLPLTD
ncbi:MAG: MFS transporter [Gammaproteobacteria bacterium]|nr:MFS transporter [Gammaproteobacteria bacterium]